MPVDEPKAPSISPAHHSTVTAVNFPPQVYHHPTLTPMAMPSPYHPNVAAGIPPQQTSNGDANPTAIQPQPHGHMTHMPFPPPTNFGWMHPVPQPSATPLNGPPFFLTPGGPSQQMMPPPNYLMTPHGGGGANDHDNAAPISGECIFGIGKEVPHWIVEFYERVKVPSVLRDAVVTNKHPLRNSWSSWLQISEAAMSNHGSSTRDYGEQMILPRNDVIDTVEDVMAFSVSVGMPSLWLENVVLGVNPNDTYSNTEKVPLDGVCFFLNGVTPQWEDETNRKGGHFELRLQANIEKQYLYKYIDHMWVTTVLALSTAAPMVDPKGVVTGIRLIKKTPKAQKSGATFLRIEVWLAKCDDDCRKNVLSNLNLYIKNSYINGIHPKIQSAILPNYSNADWKSHDHNSNNGSKHCMKRHHEKLLRADSKGGNTNAFRRG